MVMLAKMSPEIDWKDVYLMPFQTTKSTKLIVFQYKLSHRRLTTNTFLYKVLKLKENDKCTFSQTYKEDLIHLFWSCKYTVIFWTLLKLCLINHKILHKDHNFNIEVQCSLGSETRYIEKYASNKLLSTLTRCFLWCCRTTEKLPKFKYYLHQLKFYYKLEHQENKNQKRTKTLFICISCHITNYFQVNLFLVVSISQLYKN